MVSIFMLMLLIFYIFAVLFTELFRDLELEEYHPDGTVVMPFKDLHNILFTCFELMTLEWSTYTRAAILIVKPQQTFRIYCHFDTP